MLSRAKNLTRMPHRPAFGIKHYHYHCSFKDQDMACVQSIHRITSACLETRNKEMTLCSVPPCNMCICTSKNTYQSKTPATAVLTFCTLLKGLKLTCITPSSREYYTTVPLCTNHRRFLGVARGHGPP